MKKINGKFLKNVENWKIINRRPWHYDILYHWDMISATGKGYDFYYQGIYSMLYSRSCNKYLYSTYSHGADFQKTILFDKGTIRGTHWRYFCVFDPLCNNNHISSYIKAGNVQAKTEIEIPKPINPFKLVVFNQKQVLKFPYP